MSQQKEPWPWDKIKKRFRTIKPAGKIPAVLVASGHFSPPHKGHVLMLGQARERLERLGYEVLGAWLSPSNDQSVIADAQQRGVPELRHDFRRYVAELSVAEDSFTSVTRYEDIARSKYPADREISEVLLKAVNSEFEQFLGENSCQLDQYEPIRVFCVCGCDHLVACQLTRGFGSSHIGVVVVPREDTDEVVLEKPNLLLYVAEPTPGDAAALTTSKLRQAIIDGDRDYIRKAMAPEAARFILQPTVSEQLAMRKDLENLGIVNPVLDIAGTEGPWPLANLRRRLLELASHDTPAILIVSGSMSPCHQGHREVITMARQRLVRAGYKVLAGFLSPQNATGSAAEMRAAAGAEEESAFSTGFRLMTTKLFVRDDDFLSLATWEASVVGSVPSPLDVMQEATKYICDAVPELKTRQNGLRVFYACGPGQAERRGLQRSFGRPDKGVVIVPREDEDCFYMEKPHNMFFVGEPAAGEANIVVAARIRAAIRAGNAAYVGSVLPPAEARFVMSPTEAERASMKADFDMLRPEPEKGILRLADQAAANETREKMKAILQAWAGPSGVIAIKDLARLLEVLDPSWRNSEVSTFSSAAFARVSKAGVATCDDLVDWIFSSGSGC